MCGADTSIVTHQPSSALAGGDRSLCSFFLKGSKKRMTCDGFETVNIS